MSLSLHLYDDSIDKRCCIIDQQITINREQPETLDLQMKMVYQFSRRLLTQQLQQLSLITVSKDYNAGIWQTKYS